MNTQRNEQEKEETRRFYLFSTEIKDVNLVVSIPAETISDALEILGDTMKQPESWEREKEMENDLGFPKMTISGKKKAPKPWGDTGSGPMFG